MGKGLEAHRRYVFTMHESCLVDVEIDSMHRRKMSPNSAGADDIQVNHSTRASSISYALKRFRKNVTEITRLLLQALLTIYQISPNSENVADVAIIVDLLYGDTSPKPKYTRISDLFKAIPDGTGEPYDAKAILTSFVNTQNYVDSVLKEQGSNLRITAPEDFFILATMTSELNTPGWRHFASACRVDAISRSCLLLDRSNELNNVVLYLIAEHNWEINVDWQCGYSQYGRAMHLIHCSNHKMNKPLAWRYVLRLNADSPEVIIWDDLIEMMDSYPGIFVDDSGWDLLALRKSAFYESS